MSLCPSCNAALPTDAVFCPECGGARSVASAPSSPIAGLETLGGLATIAHEGTPRVDAAASDERLAPGTRFADRYVIGDVIGAGGMGVVYRAHDGVAKREVALKLVRPGRGGAPAELDRLVAEGVTARDIRHGHVVAVYDVGSWDGRAYLSMEVVEGVSLREWMRARAARREDVGVAEAISIARSIALGLGAAHAKGVVHRDLKPENVILTAEPTAEGAALKLLDFGIAAEPGTRGSGTGSGTSVGTPHYMAPEQVTHADLVTPSADIYSLSVMLYELLVGVLPQGHWQPPSGGRSDVPRALDELVAAGLSNRPANRPQTTEAFLAALDKARVDVLGDLGRRAVDGLKGLERRWKENAKKSFTGRRGIVSAVLIGVIVIAAIASEFGSDGGFESSPERFVDNVENDFGGERSSRAGDDPSVLSGSWFDVAGHGFEVDVSSNGRFSGRGAMASGDDATLRGSIENGAITGQMRVAGRKYAEFDGFWNGVDRFEVTLVFEEGYPPVATAFLVTPD